MQDPGNDHDLLVRLDTKVERLILDVSLLKDNLVSRVEFLEKTIVGRDGFEAHKKDDVVEHEKVDLRLRSLENWRWYMIAVLAGGLALAYFILKNVCADGCKIL